MVNQVECLVLGKIIYWISTRMILSRTLAIVVLVAILVRLSDSRVVDDKVIEVVTVGVTQPCRVRFVIHGVFAVVVVNLRVCEGEPLGASFPYRRLYLVIVKLPC